MQVCGTKDIAPEYEFLEQDAVFAFARCDLNINDVLFPVRRCNQTGPDAKNRRIR